MTLGAAGKRIHITPLAVELREQLDTSAVCAAVYESMSGRSDRERLIAMVRALCEENKRVESVAFDALNGRPLSDLVPAEVWDKFKANRARDEGGDNG